ncbi:MAG TPA: ribosome maturation factor RimM [Gemmatimonadaceae bacterium]|nr:ribosome maturation factor RimM [Gemmatimonadaceae bacterium]
MSDSPPGHVIVGRVRNAHGLKGELVVESLTDQPETVFAVGHRLVAGTLTGAATPRGITVRRARPFKGGWILGVDEITDRTAADLWRDRYLLIPESEAQSLEEGEVFLHELPGMRVALVSGEAVGTVAAVYELPQGLMLDVGRGDRPSVIVPYDRAVTQVDREARVIRIDPPAGLLD